MQARIAILVGIIFLALAPASRATTYSNIFVYGDSLSDNGNLYSAIGYPPAPYYNGRFSNGPVAVEQLAGLLGATLHDFAWGGATTGVGNLVDNGTPTTVGSLGLPGMLAELAAYPVPAALIPTSLFIVWGGANDFQAGGSVSTAVSDIDELVAALQSEGAKNILVPGLPNLALTPEYYGESAAMMYSQEFNQQLQASLPSGVIYDDTYSLLQSITADPSAYGFTNVTTPCFNGTTVCSDPSQYLFWDDIHPTTTMDTLLAEQFEAAVVTPEPSSLLLLGSGCVGLIAMLRRRRAA